MKDLSGIKIARVATVGFSIETQLLSQINSLVDSGANIIIISSDLDVNVMPYGVRHIVVSISRKINLLRDLRSLYFLYKVFRAEKFDIVHSITPKAGLLCALAAKLSNVPVRMHTFTGQPWAVLSGVKRHLLRFCDKLIVLLNTKCFADSFGQRKFLFDSGVLLCESEIGVLGSGSLAGVDVDRFDLSKFSDDKKVTLKKELLIPDRNFIFLYVGRITEDKGILELLNAFELMTSDHNVSLILVGPDELANRECIDIFCQPPHMNVTHVGYDIEPEKYMAIADVLCLPSYREGFGTVVIEAACMSVPAIVSDIYGLSDAVVHNHTGLLVTPGDYYSLYEAMLRLYNDQALLDKLGKAAQLRAVLNFNSLKLSESVISEYRNQLNAHSA